MAMIYKFTLDMILNNQDINILHQFGNREGYENDLVPEDLIGAQIINMGTPEISNLEGGGLIIDYKPLGSTSIRRIILSFNELGMWIDDIC